ncbi:glucan phosphoethanolaminetransferase (alkaline phosphatase superfamily) [Variovorax paradoxus]|uniref:hypothetical protein n=1 Tax=Variovorax paradoxus TaxID=34073 RepID=UPI0027906412|nr:hypothetical protein [Variovorax paradoxus]MDQ0573737.1 glucan phosphoethanolaminetransferase (alkaline phosphatase superfamily) [Variovorax paradoxus]
MDRHILKPNTNMKAIKPKSVSHPKILFFFLIGAISIATGFIAFKLDLLIAQQITLRLLQTTPTIAENAILVELFPFKVFAIATTFVFIPLLLGWYFRASFAKYILATGGLFLISALVSLSILAAYKGYMQTELKFTTTSGLSSSISKITSMTRGQITAVTDVPIAKMILSGPLMIVVGALLWIREKKSSTA